MPETHTVDLSQGPISVHLDGPEEGRPVVCVHGALVDHTVWRRVVPLLAAAGLRVVAPDLPLGSHRTAMHPDADLSPHGQARLLGELLAALDLDGVTLLANDSGGAITQLLLDHDPSRVADVVLTDCDAFETFPPQPFRALFWPARFRPITWLMAKTMAPARLRHAMGYGMLQTTPVDADQTAGWVAALQHDPAVRRDTRKLLVGISATDLREVAPRLDRFEGRVLLAWAADDPYFPMALARRLADCFRDARIRPIEGAGTFVALDRPEALAEEVLAFLDLERPEAEVAAG